MKIITWILIILWCSFPLAAHAQGKGHGVEVRAAMSLLTEAEPGSTISGSFLVTNTGAGVSTFIEEFQLPAGWIPITPQYLPFFLNVRDQQTRTIAFTVPADAVAGSYRIRYDVKSQNDPGITDSQTITVTVTQGARPAPGETEKTSPRPEVAPQPGPDKMIEQDPEPVADEQGQGIQITAARDFIREVTPGKTLTGSFLVTNTGSRTETLIDELQVPPGWKKIIPQTPAPFTLNAGEQKARIIAFSISPNAPAGSYRVTYAAHSTRDPGVFGSRSLVVGVKPVHKIEIDVAEKPEFVVAGNPFTVRFRVMNRGNSASSIKMDIRGNMKYPVVPEQTALDLAAGQSELVTVTVTTDNELKRKETYVLTISAVTKNVQGDAGTVTKNAVIFILPGTPEPVDLYHRVPAKLSMTGSARDGEHAGQIELAGGGDIDEQGNKRIEFLFRNPDLQDKNIFGLRDEYRLNYYTDNLDILTGDQGYSLSPLTEQSRYGRGGEVNFRSPTTGAGVFYLETQDQSPQVTEGGGHLFYKPTDLLGFKANFLHKETNLSADTPESTRLYSIQTSTAWDRHLALDLEYGVSDNSGVTQTTGNSYNIDLRGELKKARFAIEKTYADPHFFGYFHDSDYTTGALFFPIYRQLMGNISYRSYQNNLDLNPLLGSATDEESFRGGINLPLPTGTHLSLAYEDFQKKDRMTGFNQFNFQERFFTLGIGQSFKRASLQCYMNKGVMDNNLTGSRNTPVSNYSIYASFYPTAWQAYSLYGRTGQDLYNDNPQRSKSAGVTGTWRYKQANLNLNYQINEVTTDTYQRTNDPMVNFDGSTTTFSGRTEVLLSSLNYTLQNDHIFSIRGYWINNRNEGGSFQETSFLLSYTIPLGIPVKKKKGIGGIRGTVLDGQGKPLQQVVVEVGGLTAVTDNAGNFTFPGFKPGTYYLGVAQGSIGMGRITSEKTPRPIEVRGGETSQVSIRITPSCRVTGRLSLREPDSDGNVRTEMKQDPAGKFSLKGQEGVADKDKSALKLVNILVEISRGEESIRQVTDDKGRFSFYDLRPGIWAVKVAADNLPAYHYVEKESYQVELKGGEEQVIDIQVLPRVRKIQMIDEGQIR